MIASRRSHPRFRREGEYPAVVLTDDDHTILRHLRRHRFLRSTDVFRLMPERSADRLSRRLAALYRAGFLDRPLSQVDSFRGNGSQPLVYGLDDRGAAHLAQLDGAPGPRGTLRSRNRAYTRDNLNHTLLTASFMVNVELACRVRADIEFIPPEEILARPGLPATLPRWSVSLPWHGSRADVVVAPDALFGLRMQQRGRALRSFYLVEIDTGSMTILPNEQVRRTEAFLYRSSILRKFLAYAVSHEERAHAQHLNIPAARVLMLTTTVARAEEMQRTASRFVIAHAVAPAALFLFGAASGIDDPLSAVWRAVDGAAVSLAPNNA